MWEAVGLQGYGNHNENDYALHVGYSDYDVFLENYIGSRVYKCKKQF